MPTSEQEPFSNPLPPSSGKHPTHNEEAPLLLTNDDFRKLMMTPRAPSSNTASTTIPASSSNKSSFKSKSRPSAADVTDDGADYRNPTAGAPSGGAGTTDDPGERRKKKKNYYAKLKKLEDERRKELESKYRDRARERREGDNKDYAETEIISTTADYRAVAPERPAPGQLQSYAERRRQVIQESKYLGGDMEHTHLVKGLDYALLEKVRAEIITKETEGDELDDDDLGPPPLTSDEAIEAQMEAAVANSNQRADASREEDAAALAEERIQFKTKLGRSVFRAVFRPTLSSGRNELFLPGRMAYVVDLDQDGYGGNGSDIPTTSIRSKADCPSLEAATTLSTNDIVINKLTQILSYLRQGRRDAKRLKKRAKMARTADDVDITDTTSANKQRGTSGRGAAADIDIYGDAGMLLDGRKGAPTVASEKSSRRRDDRRHDNNSRRSYFEKPSDEDVSAHDRRGGGGLSAGELARDISDKYSRGWAPADIEREQGLKGKNGPGGGGGAGAPAAETGAGERGKQERMDKKLKGKVEIDSYAECYPGMMEMADAIDDSDEEADFTKMDQGNKKGPVGRWDFDTTEEYSTYMSKREAMPKAAFQYGVKMSDGRKTRRTGPKDEKAVLDREWQKIQNIMHSKRKADDDSSVRKSARN